MATYLPDGDTAALLSQDAQALTPGVLGVQADVAEGNLGLEGVIVTASADVNRAKAAVAHQINFQLLLAQDPDLLSSGRGRQSVSFARRGGRRVALDSTAELLASGVRSAAGISGRKASSTTVLIPVF